jgi:hypothetical protein
VPADAGPLIEIAYHPATVLLGFEGETDQDLLTSLHARIDIFDPYQRRTVRVQGADVALAGNFTSPYGLWLARSRFRAQALRTLFGRSSPLERTEVLMMQPYDPQRLTVVLIHGLAASPDSWVNVANEIMGDERLRDRWRVSDLTWEHPHSSYSAPSFQRGCCAPCDVRLRLARLWIWSMWTDRSSQWNAAEHLLAERTGLEPAPPGVTGRSERQRARARKNERHMDQDFTRFSMAFVRTRFRRDIRRSLENGTRRFGRAGPGCGCGMAALYRDCEGDRSAWFGFEGSNLA